MGPTLVAVYSTWLPIDAATQQQECIEGKLNCRVAAAVIGGDGGGGGDALDSCDSIDTGHVISVEGSDSDGKESRPTPRTILRV